jgi:hypothetical protein
VYTIGVVANKKIVAAKAAFLDEHGKDPTAEELSKITGMRVSIIYQYENLHTTRFHPA